MNRLQSQSVHRANLWYSIIILENRAYGWVINDNTSIFRWAVPLRPCWPWSWSQWQVMTSERPLFLHTPQHSVQTEQDVSMFGVSFPHSYLHSDYPYGSASYPFLRVDDWCGSCFDPASLVQMSSLPPQLTLLPLPYFTIPLLIEFRVKNVWVY